MLILLSGDAPDANGNMQYYTSEEARVLGRTLGEFAQQHELQMLVTNGPRTGQHSPVTHEKLPVHQQNSDLDQVSKTFLSAALEYIAKKDLVFADFKIGSPSLCDEFLGAVLVKGGVAVVGGESTSQIAEAITVLGRKVYIAGNKAMNINHENHVKSVLSHKYANDLEELLNSTGVQNIQEQEQIPSDSSLVADSIVEMIGVFLS